MICEHATELVKQPESNMKNSFSDRGDGAKDYALESSSKTGESVSSGVIEKALREPSAFMNSAHSL